VTRSLHALCYLSWMATPPCQLRAGATEDSEGCGHLKLNRPAARGRLGHCDHPACSALTASAPPATTARMPVRNIETRHILVRLWV
jgi:hypothetical protein